MNLLVQGRIEGERKRGCLQKSYMENFSSNKGLPYKAIFRAAEDQEKVENGVQ